MGMSCVPDGDYFGEDPQKENFRVSAHGFFNVNEFATYSAVCPLVLGGPAIPPTGSTSGARCKGAAVT